MLAERYPHFFTPHADARSFVLTLNDIIHPEVRKLYPGADVPVFDFQDVGPNTIVITYRSARRLCGLALGFIDGTAVHFGEKVDIEHPVCLLRGDDRCVLECTFAMG